MPMDERKKRLLNLIRLRSFERRDVVLTSGKRSAYYVDGKQTTLYPEGAYLTGELLFEEIRSFDGRVDAVGGPTLGADPLVTAITVSSFLHGDPLPGFLIRKAPKRHGTMQWIEGAKSLFPGAAVALVEDVMTTGGSLLKAVRIVRKLGYTVAMAGVLLDRLEGGGRALDEEGVPHFSLFTIEDLGEL